MGAQDLMGRSTSTIHRTAAKGRTRNAHFLWQPRCSCFLTLNALSSVHWSLVAFKDVIPPLFLSCPLLFLSPLSCHVYLPTCHPLDLFAFIQATLAPNCFFYFSPFYFFKRFVSIHCVLPVTDSLPLRCSCYVYSHHFLLDIKIIGFFSPL